jgi:hypothetical protein
MGAATLIIDQTTGLTVEGAGIGPVQFREVNGRKYLVTAIKVRARGQALSFRLTPMKTHQSPPRVAVPE